MYRYIHLLGNRAFGPDGWNVMRPAICLQITEGRTTSSKELTDDERRFMVERLEETKPLRSWSFLHDWADRERSRAEEAEAYLSEINHAG